MIMKKTTQYIAMAALTFSLAACTQDDILQGFNDPNAVRINATIGHLQSRVTYEASGATFFSAGDAIKVENTKRTTKNIATYILRMLLYGTVARKPTTSSRHGIRLQLLSILSICL